MSNPPGYPVNQIIDGNLTAVDVYGTDQYGTITARNFVGDGSALVNVPSGVTYPVTIAEGGTGGTTAAAARSSLGLGTAAVLNTPVAYTNVGAIPANLGEPLGTGEGTFSRLLAVSDPSPLTQVLMVTYWIAATTQTVGHIVTMTNGAALQTADCTLAELAVFAVNTATGALTSQLAITSNLHASIYAAQFTSYTGAFVSSWSQVAGTTYAVGLLIVCTGTMPQLVGITPQGLNCTLAPFMNASVTGQASMPGSVASGSLVTGGNGPQSLYAVLTP